jgi:tubulin-specific chaperone D
MRSLTMLVQEFANKKLFAKCGQELGSEAEFYERYINGLLQQLVEKIDRVREVAGRSLQTFFKFSAHKTCDFADKDQLITLFMAEQSVKKDKGAYATMAADQGIAYLPWRSADFVFKQVQRFFGSKTYQKSILRGLVTCSGGLTESTMKASQKSLFEYLSKMNGKPEEKRAFVRILIKIFEESQKNDLFTIPLMKTIETLLGSDYLSDPELVPEMLEIHAMCVVECNKCKAIAKLVAGVGVFANMLNYQDQALCTIALRSLLFLLYNVYPKVRQLAAEKLYTILLVLEDYSMLIPDSNEEMYDSAIEMLSETDWAQPVKAL